MAYSRARILRRYKTVIRVMAGQGITFFSRHEGRGEGLRRACEELGPAFIKLGQMLATRGDLLPPDVTVALEQLQDHVEPVPFNQIHGILERELGGPLERHFSFVDPLPLGSASLGQVHAATLHDGAEVVVKVQRPAVAEIVDLDLQVLQGIAALIARRTAWGREYDLPGLAREFATTLRAELDFEQEGRNAERFRASFANDPQVRFPAVHWALTTRRLLTLDRVRGLRVTKREALLQAGIPPAKVAAALAGAIFKMVMRDGFFHADPHPGNLFVAPDGGLIFVDMGMVGSLTPHMRANVVDYVVGVVSDDPDLVVDSVMRMGVVRRRSVRSAMRAELESLKVKYGQLPLAQIELGPALRDTMAMARRFEMTFPSDYVVLLKTMSTLEAVARQIDPEATLIGLAAPHAQLVMQGRLDPQEILRRTGRDLVAAGRTMIGLPRQVSRLLAMMEHGEWRLAIDHTGLDPALERLSLIANRLSIAILLASLIIGTALVGRGSTHSLFERYAIADFGFVAIGAVGLWLVWSILRSRSS